MTGLSRGRRVLTWGAALGILTVLPVSAGLVIRPGELPARGALTTATPDDPGSQGSCQPAPLAARAAAVLVAGMPDTQNPTDPLASMLPKLGVGGILLTARNVRSPAQVAALTAALRSRSASPLLITTDEEGGQVSTFQALLGPTDPAATLGRGDPDAVFRRGELLGTYLRGLGVSGDLAPVADVTAGGGSAIGDRSFSTDAGTATSDALAFARGLASGGVVPTVKHFPGLGRADADTHTEMTTVPASSEDLGKVDLAPFTSAIEAGAPVVMVGHASYPSLGISGEPASLSPAAYALLRRLGFQGVAMTDSLGMGAVNLRYDYPEAGVRALAAGADALLFTDGRQAGRMRDALVAAVSQGRLPEARLDQAAARVTALAGGDPRTLTCQDAHLPTLGKNPTGPQ